jgi:hypothetical protein
MSVTIDNDSTVGACHCSAVGESKVGPIAVSECYNGISTGTDHLDDPRRSIARNELWLRSAAGVPPEVRSAAEHKAPAVIACHSFVE